jgi:hypothetical protein
MKCVRIDSIVLSCFRVIVLLRYHLVLYTNIQFCCFCFVLIQMFFSVMLVVIVDILGERIGVRYDDTTLCGSTGCNNMLPILVDQL